MATVKSLISIQIDFATTKAQAQQLDTLAGQLEDLARSSLENSLKAIGAAWTGESAQEYIQKGELLEEKLKGSAKNLRAIAEAIRQVAQVTYNAEREAILLAQIKNNG